ncbi:hypothetical protein DITRI_Ditri13aG0078100 [Diplodiscus trichospermus]
MCEGDEFSVMVIGIVLSSGWPSKLVSSMFRRIVKPPDFGDYPETMKKIVGSRIPCFTNHESELPRDEKPYLFSSGAFFQWLSVRWHGVSAGQRTPRNSTLEDTSRVKYLQAYIGSVLDARRNGSDTRRYFVLSFLDLFELLDGYESGYGLYYVDLDDPDLKRYPKLSRHWYSHFLKGGNVSDGLLELQKIFSALSHRHFIH